MGNDTAEELGDKAVAALGGLTVAASRSAGALVGSSDGDGREGSDDDGGELHLGGFGNCWKAEGV